MEKFYGYVFLICIILIGRYYYLEYIHHNKKENKCMSYHYLLLMIIVYLLTFYISNDNQFSLLCSLLSFYGRTIYRFHTSKKTLKNRYNLKTMFFFTLAIIFPYLFFTYKKQLITDNTIQWINGLFIFYFILSSLEYIINKNNNKNKIKGNFNKLFYGADDWYCTFMRK